MSILFLWPSFIYTPHPFFQFLILEFMLFSIFLMILGSFNLSKIHFFEEVLKNSLILNSRGDPPNVKSFKEYVDGSLSLCLDIWGMDTQIFTKKKAVIEATFGLYFHELKNGYSPRYKELCLTPKRLPRFFNFKDAIKEIKKPYHVVIGMSMNGPIISDISEWPHGLIAGSTGSGKSVQMKSIIAQFIHSTNMKINDYPNSNAQIILCDLKGGVEFATFEGISNVKTYSKIHEISHVLKKIVIEMEDRFRLMKKKGIQKIIPKKHGRDFIFIAIDESSLLYKRVRKDQSDYSSIESARISTQKILKLGRAARISVLFGLQRPSKESIDTEIQENIDARMCFKINTIEGSIRMLGHKKGVDLPLIPGRGIWKLGNNERVFQAPLILDKDIKELKNSSGKSVKSEEIKHNGQQSEKNKLPPKRNFYHKTRTRRTDL